MNINQIAFFVAGAFVGISIITAPVLLSEPVARKVSQAIYDCGIRVAAGANGGVISGFTVNDHRYSFCIDFSEPL